MSARGRLALAAAALALLAGCGDTVLWERWQAERAAWSAKRRLDRIAVKPPLADAAQWRAAEAAYRAIAARWPAAVWAPRAGRDTVARDLALAVGGAAVASGRLEELHGRPAAALERYARVAADWGAVEPVALQAAVARARLLDGSGRAAEAVAAWAAVGAFPAFERGAVRPEVLDAPLTAARGLAALGREGAADSLLVVAAARYDADLSRAPSPAASAEVWSRIAEARALQGDADGSMAALRRVLAVKQAPDKAGTVVLTLAQRALDFARPDSARVYAEWAERDFGSAVRASGLELEARAWEARGVPDSAIAVWGVVLESYGGDPDLMARARSRRAGLLAGLGRWELARSEYRALIAAQPQHPLAMDAMEAIVAHHIDRREDALARLEGARAIETLDRLVATQHDPDVSYGARRTRATILQELGDAGAEAALAEVWRSDPQRPGASGAGLAAARLAEARPGGRAVAESLYASVAERSGQEAARRAAREALARLRAVPERGGR